MAEMADDPIIDSGWLVALNSPAELIRRYAPPLPAQVARQ